MDEALQTRADARFEAALEETGARDPREFYRKQMRALRDSNPEAYQRAVDYYTDELIPSIGDGDADPLGAWTAYGVRLAEWTTPGRTVEIDRTGRAHARDGRTAPDRLLIHLPDGKGHAIVVGIPSDLSPAQRATFDLLVSGRQKLRQEAPA